MIRIFDEGQTRKIAKAIDIEKCGVRMIILINFLELDINIDRT
jgi:hypothetical protein